MNIHLIVIFGKSGERSPLAVAMRKQGVTLTTFSDSVRLNYPKKVLRIMFGLPRLLRFSLVTAFKSLRVKPAADVVIVSSHFDLITFGLASKILRASRPKLVLRGFIYTEAKESWLLPFKYGYYKRILRLADVIVCHSRLEVQKNNALFQDSAGRFLFYPYAIHVAGATGYVDRTLQSKTIMSAGRSGRDYDLLIEAVRNSDVDLHIVCDQFPIALRDKLPSNVRVLDDCYRDCYFRELAACRFVVVPLSVSDISAGQMVLLQAMAMGKPTVITDTPTTEEYVQDGGVVTVGSNDVAAMRAAITRLSSDGEFCERLGRQAAEIYANKYSVEAYAANLIDAARAAFTDSRPREAKAGTR